MNTFHGNNSDDGNAQDAASQASSPDNEMEDTMMEDDGEADNDNDSNDDDKDSDNDDDDDNDNDNDGEADADGDDDDDNTQNNSNNANGQSKINNNNNNSNSNNNKNNNVTIKLQSASRSPSQQPDALSSSSSLRPRPRLRLGADTCTSYDIVPYVAAPQSTSINAMTATPCMRWLFTGGQDGYIRKFDWFASINGKVPLTVAQRHPFVDSVTRAGVLLSYWENEEVPDKNTPSLQDQGDEIKFSPVYSLATQSQALWLLSGLESGNINLQSVRHDEGKIVTVLRKHKSAVSSLLLSPDEASVLSGSWDKQLFDWDLNRGEVSRSYGSMAGQVTAISWRPQSILAIPQESVALSNGVSSSITFTNGVTTNGAIKSPPKDEDTQVDTNGVAGGEDAAGSPDSARSFGSLFGDDDDDIKLDEDDEFGQAIAQGRATHTANTDINDDGEGDAMMSGVPTSDKVDENPEIVPSVPVTSDTNQNDPSLTDSPTQNNNDVKPEVVDHNSNDDSNNINKAPTFTTSPPSDTTSSNSVFLAASIDGMVRIYDRRQDTPISRIQPGKGTPPWCMSACWSSDGNYVYVGRRNGTVEEYSVHKGLREPTRTMRFPQGSGAVSVVRSMPNGRNLICASFDNLRLYDLKEEDAKHSTVPFLIIPGHHGGVVSDVYYDPTCQYLVSLSGTRGFEGGTTTEVFLGYSIELEGV